MGGAGGRVARGLAGLVPGLSHVPGDSRLHRLHPLTKLLLLVAFSVHVFTLPHPLPALFLLALLPVGYHLAGLGLRFFLRRSRFILAFGALILLVQVAMVREGILCWRLDLGGPALEVWSGGLAGGAVMAARFLSVIGSSFLFVTTTDPNHLAYALMQAGLPYRQGFMLVTALRFIPVFQVELAQVRHAQTAKGVDLEGLSPAALLRGVRYLLVPLVISALAKVDSLTISMEGRAFGLHPRRTYLTGRRLSRTDRLQAAGIVLGSLAFQLACRWLLALPTP